MIKLVDKHNHTALREFARTMMWVFPAVFMVLLPWLFNAQIPWWPAALSAVLAFLYFVYPTGLYVPYRIWMAIAGVLGWVNTRLILAFAFYVLIFPIGLVLRLLKKLQYRKSLPQQESYWISSEQRESEKRLKEPF